MLWSTFKLIPKNILLNFTNTNNLITLVSIFNLYIINLKNKEI